MFAQRGEDVLPLNAILPYSESCSGHREKETAHEKQRSSFSHFSALERLGLIYYPLCPSEATRGTLRCAARRPPPAEALRLHIAGLGDGSAPEDCFKRRWLQMATEVVLENAV